jgi:hypothetical protein
VPEPTYDRHAERALLGARDEAARRNEPRIRPDHLFVGLVREQESGAGQVLAEFGIDLDKAGYRIGPIQHPPARPPGSPGWEPPGFTRLLRTVLQWAEQEANRLHQGDIHTEHLLLGLIAEPVYGGAGLLRICGADPDAVWSRAYEMLGVAPEQRRARPEPPPYEPSWGWGPSLTDLRRVVPIAESWTGGGHTLTLRSLEDYADGFLIRIHLRTQVQPVADRGVPEWPPKFHLRSELVVRAVDDQGLLYNCAQRSLGGSWSGGGPHSPFAEGEFSPRFAPALGEGAQHLRLEAVELRWVRLEDGTADTKLETTQSLGWVFEVPLSTGRLLARHSDAAPNADA